MDSPSLIQFLHIILHPANPPLGSFQTVSHVTPGEEKLNMAVSFTLFLNSNWLTW